MSKSKNLFCSLVMFALFGCVQLYGLDISCEWETPILRQDPSQGGCGYYGDGSCGPACHCGCNEGNPCTCKKRSGSCGLDCHCGCNEGNPCTCDGGSNSCSCSPCQCCGLKWGAPPQGVVDAIGDEDCALNRACGGIGVWLPEDPILFRPFMADPRQITTSAGWRFNDRVLVKNVIDVSYADYLPIYRWCDVWPFYGDLQLELVGALWAVFDPCHDSSPLINADYYVGGHLDYARDGWAFRLRVYHISSHIGDEFLLNHPHFDRRNPSAEYIDFFSSYDLTDDIRVYGGLGYTIAEDESFHTSRLYEEAGVEVRVHNLGFTYCKDRLYGEPIFGMHFRHRRDFHRHPIDQTYVLGYEFGKLCGLARKVRIFMEYHDGYSLEGQFCKLPTRYFALRATYGF